MGVDPPETQSYDMLLMFTLPTCKNIDFLMLCADSCRQCSLWADGSKGGQL